MPKLKEGGFQTDVASAAPMIETTLIGGSRSPITIAVMGRAVLVELTHGFDLLVLVLETGPVAHLCQKGRVVARLPMAAC
jgi:hypothetical protein